MPRTKVIEERVRRMLVVFATLAFVACGDDDASELDATVLSDSGSPALSIDAAKVDVAADAGSQPWTSDAATDAAVPNPVIDAGDDGKPGVYALLWIVLGDEDSTSYIQLSDSLEVTPSLAKAREFGGWASMGAVSGKLLVSDGDAPRLTAFAVDNLQWSEGPTLNFANTGATTADFGSIWLLNETTAYLTLETTSRVVFDPTAMKILGAVKDDTDLEPTRAGGQKLNLSWHRQSRFPVRDRVLIPFYYYKESSEPGPSIIASYDPKTHEEQKLTEVNCEGLEVESQDEQGNTYYSSWWSWQVGFVYGKAPASCVVRIKPDGSLDESWGPKNFLDVTGGRPLAAWQYLKDGKAVASVLHKEQLDVSGEFNPDLELRPYYAWMFDLNTGEAHKIEGIPETGWGFQVATVAGRTLLLIPNPDWNSTTAYELDLKTGSVKALFTAEGWLYDVLRVK